MAGELAFFTMAALFSIIFFRSEISEWGHNKKRQQLDSKTPYDYALTNVINERDRLQDVLRKIQATKRIETDIERIRNEIGTVLSEDGEEAAEDVYGGLNGIPIVQHSDGTISPFPRWDNRISSGEATDNISKAFAKAYGTDVREDDTKDEQSSEDYEERSLTEAVRDSFENKEIIRVTWRDSSGSLRFRRGIVDEIATGDGKVKKFGMQGLEIFARDVVRIMKGDDENGETLYRKGSR